MAFGLGLGPVPTDQRPVWSSAQSEQQLVVVGESHTDVFVEAAISELQVLPLPQTPQVVDEHHSSVCPFRYCAVPAIWADCESSNAFCIIISCDELLSFL